MADTVQDLRSLIERHRNKVQKNAGYPEPVRQRVGAYARRRRQAGARWSELAAELGISSTTMSNWMRALPPEPTFLPVPVSTPTPPPQQFVTVTSPGGWRIDGLSFSQLAEMMAVMR